METVDRDVFRLEDDVIQDHQIPPELAVSFTGDLGKLQTAVVQIA